VDDYYNVQMVNAFSIHSNIYKRRYPFHDGTMRRISLYNNNNHHDNHDDNEENPKNDASNDDKDQDHLKRSDKQEDNNTSTENELNEIRQTLNQLFQQYPSTTLDATKTDTTRSNDTTTNSMATNDYSFLASQSPPPLTTILKQRRMQEIQLLYELEYSNDDAVESLWKLWSMERGQKYSILLLKAEQHMAIGEFELAQQLLHSLIQTHGIHWAEPVNKLATLYYMTGQYEKSKELCLLVLQVKPWHFGALSGIVLVCIAMNDVTGARFWADRRLPPIVPIDTSGGDRRSQWVQRAVQDAKESLDRAVDCTWNACMSNDEEEDGNEDGNDGHEIEYHGNHNNNNDNHNRNFIERQEMEFRQSRNQMKKQDDDNGVINSSSISGSNTIYWNEMDDSERNSSWQ
jgi:hypothetical protein